MNPEPRLLYPTKTSYAIIPPPDLEPAPCSYEGPFQLVLGNCRKI